MVTIIDLADYLAINKGGLKKIIMSGISGSKTMESFYADKDDDESKQLVTYFKLKRETYEEIGRELGVEIAS